MRLLQSLKGKRPGASHAGMHGGPALPPRRAQQGLRFMRYCPRGAGSLLTVALLAVVGIYGGVRGGHLDAFRAEQGEPLDAIARMAGFGIKSVAISGLSELKENEILAAAGITPLRSLAFLNATEVRERLERVPMIRSAAVSKLYPDALSITVVEREPRALWQVNGEVFVIAGDGTVIDLMNDARFARLPFVAGEGANLRVKEYVAIRDAAGGLTSQMRAGILVSGRRWDVKFHNGLTARLPEQGAVEAMQRLAELEQREGLLEKDIIAIDMRQPDRIAMRLSEEGAAARRDVKKQPARVKDPQI